MGPDRPLAVLPQLLPKGRVQGGEVQDDVNVETAFGLVIVTLVRADVTSEDELEQNVLDFLALEEKATSYNVPVIEAKQIIPFLK